MFNIFYFKFYTQVLEKKQVFIVSEKVLVWFRIYIYIFILHSLFLHIYIYVFVIFLMHLYAPIYTHFTYIEKKR